MTEYVGSPKISVITVCYNSEKTILESLNSFNNQDYLNKELIIIDGKSSDDTLNIIRQSNIKYEVLISEKDNGIYDAINKGISLSSGNLIGLLHSDDIFIDNYCLTKIANKYIENKSDGIYADLEYVANSNPSRIIRRWNAGAFKRKNFIYGWMPPHPTLYVTRDAYKKFGLYNLDFSISSDYELILRFFWTNSLELSYIPDTLIRMKTGGTSNRNLRNIVKKTREDAVAIRKNNLKLFPTLLLKNLSKIKQFF